MTRSLRTPLALAGVATSLFVVAPLAVAGDSTPARSPIVVTTAGTPAAAEFRLEALPAAALPRAADAPAVAFLCSVPSGWRVTPLNGGNGVTAVRPDGQASVSCSGHGHAPTDPGTALDRARADLGRRATVTAQHTSGDRRVVWTRQGETVQFSALVDDGTSLVQAHWRFPAGERGAWEPMLTRTAVVQYDADGPASA